VPTTAVGRPVTGTVTGLGSAISLPVGATAVEQPAVSGTAVAVLCGRPEEYPASPVIALADTTTARRR
jgi:hypothetical protein